MTVPDDERLLAERFDRLRGPDTEPDLVDVRVRSARLRRSVTRDARPGARTFARLSRWMRSTQAVLGPVGTHGRRPIDDIYLDRTLTPLRHTARPTVSDHDCYLVTVQPKEHR